MRTLKNRIVAEFSLGRAVSIVTTVAAFLTFYWALATEVATLRHVIQDHDEALLSLEREFVRADVQAERDAAMLKLLLSIDARLARLESRQR